MTATLRHVIVYMQFLALRSWNLGTGPEEDEKKKKLPGHLDNAARRERQGGAYHQPAKGEY